MGVVEQASGHWTWQVPAGWRQGRGAWGGLVIGALLRVVEASAGQSGDGQALRTISAQISAPVAGAVDIDVRSLRVGSSMTTWQVLVSAAEHLASAVIITGTDRGSADQGAVGRGVAHDPDLRAGLLPHVMQQVTPPPIDGDWPSVPVVPVRPPLGPEFAEHLEFRVVDGWPLSGGAPRTCGWIRDPDDGSWDAVRILAIVDAWWPCLYVTLARPRPMATVDFTAHLVGEPAQVLDGEPLWFDAELIAMRGGYVTERRRLWTSTGALLVESVQALAVIR